jgi:D-lyxose ketol-isomerase
MKRSEINAILAANKKLLEENNIKLPPFGYWRPEEWTTRGTECNEIRDCALGWDVTDFAKGGYDKLGLTLFTVRNGHREIEKYKDKTYCEKLLFIGENQITPMHMHKFKMEDIINRAGGNLIVELYMATDDLTLDKSAQVVVTMDGVEQALPAGAKLTLKPGESVTLPPYLYHEFWAEEGTGTSILGEVSKVNDDNNDNFFIEPLPRFTEIEEDEPPLLHLCNEYPPA